MQDRRALVVVIVFVLAVIGGGVYLRAQANWEASRLLSPQQPPPSSRLPLSKSGLIGKHI